MRLLWYLDACLAIAALKKAAWLHCNENPDILERSCIQVEVGASRLLGVQVRLLSERRTHIAVVALSQDQASCIMIAVTISAD